MRPQRQWTELKDKALQDTDDALRTLQTFPPLDEMTVQRLREELMLESTYDSNAIEGSCLTLRETVIVVKDAVTVGSGLPIRDVMAARGYAAGFEAIFDLAPDETPLTVETVRDFHRYVMLGELPKFCGLFRDHDVGILGASFKPANPGEIAEKVSDLVEWFNRAASTHPIERAAIFHAVFETIHPFADGNGRTGRLLMNYMLVQAGYWPVNVRCKEDRQIYYDALTEFNQTGKADALTTLIAKRAKDQLDYCIHIAKQKALVEQMGIGR